ncbi:RNA recognition motif domain-containing protein [Ditylenchus destructor]|nr:RNA recognition motif domain-containing protein [Ditylenchus destructor]
MSDYVPGAISSLITPQNGKSTSKRKKLKKDEPLDTDRPGSSSFLRNTDDSFKLEEGVTEIIVKKPKVEKKDPAIVPRNRALERQQTEDRTVFVGNAPAKTKRRAIKKLFSQCGPIEAVYERSLLQKNEKLTMRMLGTDKKIEKNLTSTNFFVRFKDEEDVQKALKLNGSVVDDNPLRVSLATKKEFEPANTVFVGNLPFDTTENDLRQHFLNCGAIDGIRIIHDKTTGRGIGIAYVAFEDRSSTLLAINLNEKELKGRNIRISKVLKKNKRPLASSKSASVNKQRKKKEKVMKRNSKVSTLQENQQRKEERPQSQTLSKKVRKAIKKRTKSKSSKSLMS